MSFSIDLQAGPLGWRRYDCNLTSLTAWQEQSPLKQSFVPHSHPNPILSPLFWRKGGKPRTHAPPAIDSPYLALPHLNRYSDSMYEDFHAADRLTGEHLHCTWEATIVAIASRPPAPL